MLLDSGGATALIAATAKPLPKWAGFIFLPAVAISSVWRAVLPENPL